MNFTHPLPYRFDEFYRMVTGGREPPAGLRLAARQSIIGNNTINLSGGLSQGTLGGSFVSTSPQTGPEVVKARNAKRKALDEFARDNYLKPESIKRAHRRFQVLDKKKSGGKKSFLCCFLFIFMYINFTHRVPYSNGLH